MTEKCNYARAQTLIEQKCYVDALRFAGPLLEQHPDNLPAWYQVATATAHLNPDDATIRNLESAAASLAPGLFPLQALVCTTDDLLSSDARRALLQQLAAQYGADASDAGNRCQPRRVPCIEASPWSPALSRDELKKMGDSLCAVAWGNSLDATQNAPPGELPIFSALPANAFIMLASQMHTQYANTGDILIRGGTKSESVLLLTYGSAQCETHVGNHQYVTQKFTDRAVLGEESLVTGNVESADIVASEPCVVLTIPVASLKHFAQTQPALATELARLYQQRILQLFLSRHPQLTCLPVAERSAFFHRCIPVVAAPMQLVLDGTIEDNQVGSVFIFSGSVTEISKSLVATGAAVSSELWGTCFARGDWIAVEQWSKSQSGDIALVATENTIALKLSQTDFRAILLRYPQLSEAMQPLRKCEP